MPALFIDDVTDHLSKGGNDLVDIRKYTACAAVVTIALAMVVAAFPAANAAIGTGIGSCAGDSGLGVGTLSTSNIGGFGGTLKDVPLK